MRMYLVFLSVFIFGFSFSQVNSDAKIDGKLKMKRSCSKIISSLTLDQNIPEGSGLVAWNGKLWTHNDSEDPTLYALDTVSGKIVDRYKLPLKNKDWEELCQDADYFYLGDIGNNTHRRDTLSIYRIKKQSLLRNNVILDTISFSWPNRINPDCEAMIVVDDSIYLFTKEWQTTRQTRVFSVPAKPGKYQAHYHSALPTRVLVTGASFDNVSRRLVLCGYNLTLRPFLLVFDDVSGNDFLRKDGRKIKIRKRFRQIEGITTFDGSGYYLISEEFKFLFIKHQPQLHTIKLRD